MHSSITVRQSRLLKLNIFLITVPLLVLAALANLFAFASGGLGYRSTGILINWAGVWLLATVAIGGACLELARRWKQSGLEALRSASKALWWVNILGTLIAVVAWEQVLGIGINDPLDVLLILAGLPFLSIWVHLGWLHGCQPLDEGPRST